MSGTVNDLLSYVARYLDSVGGPSWTTESLTDVVAAEQAAQANACTIPAPDVDGNALYPHDLAEALARRVATNLANRNLPLGVQAQVAEFGSTQTKVGGYDREVSRLERPYRNFPAG